MAQDPWRVVSQEPLKNPWAVVSQEPLKNPWAVVSQTPLEQPAKKDEIVEEVRPVEKVQPSILSPEEIGDPESALIQGAQAVEQPVKPVVAAPTAPAPYKSKIEALDDAVNLIEEGYNPDEVYSGLEKLGINRQEIIAHGRQRGSERFAAIPTGPQPVTTPPSQPPMSFVPGEVQPWEMGWVESTANLFKRVDAGFKEMATGTLLNAGALTPEQAAWEIKSAARKRAAAAPSEDVKNGMMEIASAETYGDAASAMLRNPKATFSMLVESLLTSAPALAAAIATGPAAPLTAFGASGAMEYSGVMTDVLSDHGIPLDDPMKVAQALQDPKIIKEMQEKGAKRGLIIGALDALTMGLAGRFLRPAMQMVAAGKLSGAAAKRATVAAWSKELAMQSAGGAGGEFLAQKATGEDKPAEVLLEGLADIATAPIEARANLRQAKELERLAALQQPPVPQDQIPQRVEPTLDLEAIPTETPETPEPFLEQRAAPQVRQPVAPPEMVPGMTAEEEFEALPPPQEEEVAQGEAAPPEAVTPVAPTEAAAALPETPTVPPAKPVKIEEPPQETSISGMAVQEVPLSDIKLSKDVPQFKAGASEEGVVEPLGGKFERVGVAPIQVWRRLDGTLEVISGRHRLDLAKRSGEKSIPAQIHDESKGFGLIQAATLDAELNIRDGQGKVKDYVNYFKGSGISREEANARGLLARATGKRSYTIATDGSEELIAAVRGDQVPDEAAYYIALNAPNDAKLQAVGIKAIQEGKSGNAAVNLMQAVKALGVENDTTTDMFGFDDSAMKEAQAMANIAARKQREMQARLNAITGAAKNPKLAAEEGIDIRDPEAVRRRIEEIRQRKAQWDNFSTNPELIAEIRAERGIAAPQLELRGETEQEIIQREATQEAERKAAEEKAIADREVDMFGLQPQVQEREEAPTQDMFGAEGIAQQPPKAPAPPTETGLFAAPKEEPKVEPKIGQVVKRIELPNNMEARVVKTSDGYGALLYDKDADRTVDKSVTRYKGVDALERATKKAEEIGKPKPPEEPPEIRLARKELEESKKRPNEVIKGAKLRRRRLLLEYEKGIKDAARGQEVDAIGELEEAGNEAVNNKPTKPDTPAKQRLVLMPCCDTKADKAAPAMELYKGAFFQTFAKNVPAGANPNVVILSAKHGFISPDKVIEPYDQVMTDERAKEMLSDLDNRLTEVKWPSDISDVLIVGGKEYQRVMRAAVAKLIEQGKISKDASVNVTKGGIGDQRSQLGAYLRDIPAPVADKKVLDKYLRKVKAGKTSEAYEDYNGKNYRTVTSEWQGTIPRDEFDALVSQAESTQLKRGQKYSIILQDTPTDSSTLAFTARGLTPTQQRVEVVMQLQTSSLAEEQLQYTPEQLQNAEDIAKNFGGEVVWIQGDYALIRGYSVLTGDPLYSGSKGNRYTIGDIENFTGDLFPADIKATMIAEKKRNESEDNIKHERTPFIVFDNGVALSEDISPELAGVIREWKNLLKLDVPVYVSTIEDAKKNRNNFTGPHRRIGSGTLDKNESGSMRRMSDGSYYILFEKSAKPTKMLEVIAHEMGHLHQRIYYEKASPEEKQALKAAHMKWLEGQKGKTAQELVDSLRGRAVAKETRAPEGKSADELTSYWKSFGEWYADQTSRWAVSAERPVTIVEKFFKRLGNQLRQFYQKLRNAKYLPDETFKEYIERATSSPANLEPGKQDIDRAERSQIGFDFDDEKRVTDEIAKANPVVAKALHEADQLPNAKKKLPPGRSPELAAAAKMVQDGSMTSAEYDKLVNKYRPIPVYTEPLVPATDEQVFNALDAGKRDKINPSIAPLHPVGLRLDIPAFNRHGVFVVSIHEKRSGASPGKVIGYASVASVKDATFGVGNQKAALKIATGEAKDALQTIEGKYSPISAADAYRRAKEAISSGTWVQIGIDPTRHSYFYDRKTTQPVIKADEVLQIGNMVLGRGVTYGAKEQFLYNIEPPTDQGVTKTVRDENFKRWSRNAPLVLAKDALGYNFQDGKPFVAQSYHGTNAEEDFTVFSTDKLGLQTGAESADMGYFSTSAPEVAGSYAANLGVGRALGLSIYGATDLKNDPEAKRLQNAVSDAEKAGSKAYNDAINDVINQIRKDGKFDLDGLPEKSVLSFARSLLDTKNYPGYQDRKAKIDAAQQAVEDARADLTRYIVGYEASKIPQRIMPLYVRMSNPKVYDAKGKSPAEFAISERIREAKKDGHDGVVFKNIADPSPVAVHYVSFNNTDLKSAIGNIGTFEEKDDILLSIGSPFKPDSVSETIREGQIDEYRRLRAELGKIPRQIAKGEFSLDTQRLVTELLKRTRQLQMAIRVTAPRRDTPQDFLAKALREHSEGNISDDVLNLINTVYNKNPELLDGLLLRVRQPKDERVRSAGSFSSINRIITLYKETSGVDSPVTVRHELTHSLEQMMTPQQRMAVVQAWGTALQRAIKKNPDEKHQKYFNAILDFIDTPTPRRMQVALDMLPSYEMYQFLNPSEFWAVNAEKLLDAQMGPAWGKFKKSVRGLWEAIKKLFGVDNKSDIYKVFNQVMGGSKERITEDTLRDLVSTQRDVTDLQNIEDDKKLLQKYNRPNTPMSDLNPAATFVTRQWKNGKGLFNDFVDNPREAISSAGSKAVDSVLYVRNKNVFYGAGLESADFARYGGALRTSEGLATASLALDNAIHSGNIGIEVLFLGGLRFSAKASRFVAEKRDKGMHGVYKAQNKLQDRLGKQLATNVIQGYLEAKRSISIMDELYEREAAYEGVKEDLERARAAGDKQEVAQLLIMKKEIERELEGIQSAVSSVNMSEDEMREFAALDEKYSELRDIMENWTAINQNLLKVWRQVGLLSEGRYQRLAAIKDYVPWNRIMNDEEDVHSPLQSTTRTLTNIGTEKLFRRGKPISVVDFTATEGQQKFKIQPSSAIQVEINGDVVPPDMVSASPDGEVTVNVPIHEGDVVLIKTNREIENIIDNMTRNTMRMTMNAIRQYAAQRIVKEYASRTRDGKIIQFDSPNKEDGRFTFIQNGRRTVVRIADPLLAEAIFGMEQIGLEMFKPLAMAANFTRRAITLSGAFQVKQVFKDAPQAAFITGVKNPIALIGGAWKGFLTALFQPVGKAVGINIEPVVDILRAAGIGGFHSPARTPEAEIKRRLGIMNRNIYQFVIKTLDHIGDSSDMAQRIAVYKRVMAETGDQAQALYQAANVINFMRHGSSGAAQAMVKTVPFSGAYLNSMDVLMTALVGGGLKGTSRKKALARLGVTGTILGTSTILYAMLAGGDPEYDELDDQTKLRNYIIPGTKIMLPANTGAAFIYKALPEMIYNAFIKEATKDEHDARRVKVALAQAARDMLLGPEPVPAGVKPVIEIVLDHNFFTGRPVTPPRVEGLDKSEQYIGSTSELAKRLSELTKIPGTDGRVLSPVQADHLVRGIFGTAGAAIAWITNSIGAIANVRPEPEERETPIKGAFLRPEIPRGREDLFYDLKSQTETKYKTWEAMLNRGKDEEADEYLKKNGDVAFMNDYCNEVSEDLRSMGELIDMAENSVDKNYTAAQRRKDIDEYKKIKNEILDSVKDIRVEAFGKARLLSDAEKKKYKKMLGDMMNRARQVRQ